MALTQRNDPYRHWEYVHPGSGDILRIVPERGGLVTSWCCGGEERLYLDQQRFRDQSQSVRGGIPVLFPICGGLTGSSFALPQHGFARDSSWKIQHLSDDQGVKLELRDTAESRAIYPFAFQMTMTMRLEDASLVIHTVIHNHGDEIMPFCFGLHPYFAVSDLGGVRVEGLPPEGLDQLTMNKVSTDQQIDLMAEGIDLLMEPQPGNVLRLVDASAKRWVQMELTAPMDLAVLWTDPPRPMVCLEPWTSPRQALVTGERRLDLPAGETAEFTTRFKAGLE